MYHSDSAYRSTGDLLPTLHLKASKCIANGNTSEEVSSSPWTLTMTHDTPLTFMILGRKW
ncbi:hypothetical protein E2C01_079232 [Portunus trituberculatus]|uniref:Uncharacterized protein n=1 Tax=Portunus trituberculatus TaxID=210409 RepID=A0A5B7IQ26_PORTR|nr:hypothetical protein [Portunus trituberculatus]